MGVRHQEPVVDVGVDLDAPGAKMGTYCRYAFGEHPRCCRQPKGKDPETVRSVSDKKTEEMLAVGMNVHMKVGILQIDGRKPRVRSGRISASDVIRNFRGVI